MLVWERKEKKFRINNLTVRGIDRLENGKIRNLCGVRKSGNEV